MLNITATIHGVGLLELKLERPLFKNHNLIFETPDEAKGAPLVEEIFGISGINEVFLSDDLVRLRLSGEIEARGVAREVGALIRKYDSQGEMLPLNFIETFEKWKKSDKEQPQEYETGEMVEQIKDLVANQVNPVLAEHKGFVEVLGVKNFRLYVRMGGGCQGCGAAKQTLGHTVSSMVRKRFPEIREIIDLTKHEEGLNPFY